MKNTCYKIVSIDNNDESVFYSYLKEHTYNVHVSKNRFWFKYKLNEPTYCSNEQFPIYAFKSKIAVFAWIKSLDPKFKGRRTQLKLLKCSYEEIDDNDGVVFYNHLAVTRNREKITHSKATRFLFPLYQRGDNNPPLGTVFAKSITPLEII